jgi:hypothetical protein
VYEEIADEAAIFSAAKEANDVTDYKRGNRFKKLSALLCGALVSTTPTRLGEGKSSLGNQQRDKYRLVRELDNEATHQG